MTPENALQVVPQETAIVALSGSPDEIINKAIAMAKPLAKVVREAGLAVKIGDKEHVTVEGWNILGAFCGVLPQVEWTRKVSDEPLVYEARVLLVNAAGRTIGAVEGMASGAEVNMIDAKRKCPKCSKETLVFFKEAKYGPFKGKAAFWCGPRDGGCNDNFPGNDERITSQPVGKVPVPATWTTSEASIRSMAQTRTIGKAYRSVLSWVMKLAGFEPTPLEEMPVDPEASRAVVVEPDGPGAPISESGVSGGGKPETPASGPSSAPATDWAAHFKSAMEAHYGVKFRGAGAGKRLTRSVNAVAEHAGVAIKCTNWREVTPAEWETLAKAADTYVAARAGASMEAANRDVAPPTTRRWQDNAGVDADAELDAAARGMAAAATEDEEQVARERYDSAKRTAKASAQATIYASANGLIEACQKASAAWLKAKKIERLFIFPVGGVMYFIDGDILDACGIVSEAGVEIDALEDEQRTNIRRSVEAAVEGLK